MNLFIIFGIIAVVSGAVVYYAKNLKKFDTDLEYSSEYEIEYLINKVKDVFASTQKANLREQNLSKSEYEKEKRKKKKLTDNLKTAAFGDGNAKKYIKDSIKEILIDPRGGNITPETVDLVIPFNDESKLTMQDKADIIFYMYYKRYGMDGFKKFMLDNGFEKPRAITLEEEEDKNLMRYEVTKEDFEAAFANFYQPGRMTYDDKIEIICQRIFAKYKGFGAVDMLTEFAIDEIDVGNNGIMEGAYELKGGAGDGIPYSYTSIFVVFRGLNIKLSFMSFDNHEELVRVCQNIYKFSTPYALSRRAGYVVGTMKDGSRIAVSRPPVGSSWGFWLRKFDSSKALSPEKLLTYNDQPEPGRDKVIVLSRWIMKTCRSMMVTGGMGTGKTTWLKAIIRYIPTLKNIRTYEISPELNLQFTYPNRNVFNFAVTESITMEDLYTFGKKCNAQINIVGEAASAEMGVIFVESATVGSEMALGTHHAKTAEDLVLALRDNLTMAGGYNDEKVAEEVVSKVINFNTHMAREKDHRYIERITEIIPIRDRSYPCDTTGKFGEKDREEFYKRMTDRRTFTTKNIIEYRGDHYEVVNRLSPEIYETMRNYLPEEDVAKFDKDMAWLFDGVK